MKNRTSHTGTLRILQRLPNSYHGNPRYLAAILDSAGNGPTFVTAVDSSLAYSLPNHDGERVTAIIGTHYGRATLDQLEKVQQ